MVRRTLALLVVASLAAGCRTSPTVVGATPAPADRRPAPAIAMPPPAGAQSPSAAIAPTAPQPHEQETAQIRQRHLARLEARFTAPAGELARTCRYESDIATRPPVRRVALSFDDGPEPGQTEAVLDLLDKYDIPAVFFMIGEKVRRHPELAARVRASRHGIIGNHSWDHPNFHDISAAQQADEVLRDDALIFAAADAGPRLFRYPFGNASCETNALLRARGYRIVGWHVDSCDWAFEKTGAVDLQEALSCGVAPRNRDNYVGHVVAALQARNGGIVLMHEIHPRTIARLEQIIVELRAAGFVFAAPTDAAFEDSLR